MNPVEIARMVVRIAADAAPYVAGIGAAIGATGAFGQTFQNLSRVMGNTMASIAAGVESVAIQVTGLFDSMLGKVSQLGGTFLAFGAAVTSVSGTLSVLGLNQSAALEQTNLAFSTLLGNVQMAEDTVERLMRFADQTPFSDQAILSAARGLIAFGEEGDQLMKTMEDLGNAASGTSSDFGMLALIFNQIRGSERLLRQDFRQLATRGVLNLQDLARHFRVTAAEADRMITEGRVGFKDVQAILGELSETGGRFHDMMKTQSESLAGLWETFKGYVLVVLRDIGNRLAPFVKLFLDAGIRILKAWDALPEFFKTLLGTIVAIGLAIGIAALAIGSLLVAIAPLIGLTMSLARGAAFWGAFGAVLTALAGIVPRTSVALIGLSNALASAGAMASGFSAAILRAMIVVRSFVVAGIGPAITGLRLFGQVLYVLFNPISALARGIVALPGLMRSLAVASVAFVRGLGSGAFLTRIVAGFAAMRASIPALIGGIRMLGVAVSRVAGFFSVMIIQAGATFGIWLAGGKKVAEQMEKIGEQQEMIMEKIQNNVAATHKEADGYQTVAEKVDFYREKVKRTTDQVAGLKLEEKNLKKELAANNTLYQDFASNFTDATTYKVLEQQIKNNLAQQKELTKATGEFTAKIGEIDDAPFKEVSKTVAELQKEIRQFGKESTDAALAEMEIVAGTLPAEEKKQMMERIRFARKLLEERKSLQAIAEQDKATEEKQKAADKAREERMSSHAEYMKNLGQEIKLLEAKARTNNGDTTDLERVNEMTRILQETMGELTAKEYAAIRAKLEHRDALRKYIEAVEQGKQITEEFLTPQEKYLKKTEELVKLRSVLGDSFETTFAKAMEAARKDMIDAATDAENLSDQVKAMYASFQDVGMVRAGTAEFRKLVSNAFLVQERMKLGGNLPAAPNKIPNQPLVVGNSPAANQANIDKALAANAQVPGKLDRIGDGIDKISSRDVLTIEPVGFA